MRKYTAKTAEAQELTVNEKAKLVLEKHFKVHDMDDDDRYECETWTDGGVNMFVLPDKDNIIETFCDYVRSFDMDDEIDVHRQDRQYCRDFSIRESVADFEAYEEWLRGIEKEMKALL